VFILCLNAQDAVIAVEKMNVFYMGVDNPISVAMPNVSSDKLKVTGENVESINKQSDGHYNVRVARPGEVTIIVEANGQISKKKFRAKQIPDPIVIVAGARGFEGGEAMNVDNFRFAQGLVSHTINFDFDARCSIQSYIVFIKPKRGDVFQTNVIGGTFPEEVKKRIVALEIGDMVSFFEIKTRCPGDSSGRSSGSLSYTMK
jgi:GldM C-terminal domain